ncbi:hypothetical protein EDB92DRAFT_1951565 [Lactarius akahatsu]|uniref:Transmembrane protein n=1 Tax=Lactarius akahatsu TaxID=416441 RepID=A0AAD4LA72_9AGAM|nr:hypothetical protein EDB92DRAFT_1951565 [Lactarius akahatsu]
MSEKSSPPSPSPHTACLPSSPSSLPCCLPDVPILCLAAVFFPPSYFLFFSSPPPLPSLSSRPLAPSSSSCRLNATRSLSLLLSHRLPAVSTPSPFIALVIAPLFLWTLFPSLHLFALAPLSALRRLSLPTHAYAFVPAVSRPSA